MSAKPLRWLAIYCALGTVILASSGCDMDRRLVSLTATFLPGELRYKVLGSTSDRSLDAIFASQPVLDHIDEADWLMAQARETSDPSLMADAVEIRPRDWRLRVETASLFLAFSDTVLARTHLQEAEASVPERLPEQVAYASEVIDRLDPLKEHLDSLGYETVGQCQLLHDQLVHSYTTLWTLEGNSGESPQARVIAAQRLSCSEHVRQ